MARIRPALRRYRRNQGTRANNGLPRTPGPLRSVEPVRGTNVTPARGNTRGVEWYRILSLSSDEETVIVRQTRGRGGYFSTQPARAVSREEFMRSFVGYTR